MPGFLVHSPNPQRRRPLLKVSVSQQNILVLKHLGGIPAVCLENPPKSSVFCSVRPPACFWPCLPEPTSLKFQMSEGSYAPSRDLSPLC